MRNRNEIEVKLDGLVRRIEGAHVGLKQRDERVFRLALNEARALAWQTEMPHLVLPELAEEKLRKLVAWQSHQERVRRESPRFKSFAA